MLKFRKDPEFRYSATAEFIRLVAGHSEKSAGHLYKRLVELDDRPDLIEVDYIKNGEIGLLWYREGGDRDRSITHGDDWEANDALQPYMVGALVYNEVSDSWGIHT